MGSPRRVDPVFSGLLPDPPGKISVVECCLCGLFYVYPIPRFSDRLLRRIYSDDNNYFREMTPAMEKIVHWQNPERRLTAIEKYARRPIRRFLEIGCGEGFALLAARRRNWEVYGQEISPDYAAAAFDRTGVDVMLGPVEAGDYHEDFFDCIYIDSVLEHIINPLEVMASLHSFLAPGGVLYVTLPNEGSFFNAAADMLFRLTGSKSTSRLMPFAPPYHLMGFTEKSLRYVSGQVGFEVCFIIRKFSYNHIKRFKTRFSPVGAFKRCLLGVLFLAGDAAGNGSNMEALFRKNEGNPERSAPAFPSVPSGYPGDRKRVAGE